MMARGIASSRIPNNEVHHHHRPWARAHQSRLRAVSFFFCSQVFGVAPHEGGSLRLVAQRPGVARLQCIT